VSTVLTSRRQIEPPKRKDVEQLLTIYQSLAEAREFLGMSMPYNSGRIISPELELSADDIRALLRNLSFEFTSFFQELKATKA
jgi:hypothetical protein